MTLAPHDWPHILFECGLTPSRPACTMIAKKQPCPYFVIGCLGWRMDCAHNPCDRPALLSDGNVRIRQTRFVCMRDDETFDAFNVLLTANALIAIYRLMASTAITDDPVLGTPAKKAAGAMRVARAEIFAFVAKRRAVFIVTQAATR